MSIDAGASNANKTAYPGNSIKLQVHGFFSKALEVAAAYLLKTAWFHTEPGTASREFRKRFAETEHLRKRDFTNKPS